MCYRIANCPFEGFVLLFHQCTELDVTVLSERKKTKIDAYAAKPLKVQWRPLVNCNTCEKSESISGSLRGTSKLQKNTLRVHLLGFFELQSSTLRLSLYHATFNRQCYFTCECKVDDGSWVRYQTSWMTSEALQFVQGVSKLHKDHSANHPLSHTAICVTECEPRSSPRFTARC